MEFGSGILDAEARVDAGLSLFPSSSRALSSRQRDFSFQLRRYRLLADCRESVSHTAYLEFFGSIAHVYRSFRVD